MYLLDTNVVSEIRKIKGGRANARVAAWIATVDAAALYLSVVSVFEIEMGIARLDRRDTTQADLLRHWLDRQLIPTFGSRLLDIDLETARYAARLHVPDPRPFADALLAATAHVRGLAIVTRNGADFAGTGPKIVDPWTWSEAL